MSIGTRFHSTFERAHRDYGVTIHSKDKKQEWLWKAIDWVLRIVSFGKLKKASTKYTTTLGNRIYYPSGWSIDHITPNDYVILCHELKHVRQYITLGDGSVWCGFIIFILLYLFIPFPIGLAYFRYRFEREAYRISWYTALELGLKPNLDWYIDALSGSAYLWAWPFKKMVRTWFTQHCRSLNTTSAEA